MLVVSALDIYDLHKLKTLAVVAMNHARKDAEALAGADFLAALRVDGCRAQPQLGEQAKRGLERVDALAALADRVGIVLDAEMVAADPDGKNYPAAHARVRERAAAADPAKAPF